jgi:hypothetical protein
MRAERLGPCQRRHVVAAKVVRRLGQQHLATMRCRDQPRHLVERRPEVVAVPQLHRARMQRHPHAQRRGRRPWLVVQRALRFERGGNRVGRRVECGAERIAAGLEHVAVMRVDAMAQQRVVSRERCAHCGRLRFPEPRAAFDVGEQHRDGAGGRIGHGIGSRRRRTANHTRTPEPAKREASMRRPPREGAAREADAALAAPDRLRR